jgi:hypothetical protein
MPDALPGGFQGGSVPPAHATPALVAHAQGGLTLGLEQGELDADFCSLGDTRDVKSVPTSLSRPPTPCRFEESHLANRVSQDERRVSAPCTPSDARYYIDFRSI